ncbi:MAG: gamma-glutamyltransferase family protein [Myxococcota bacterium]
MSFTTRPTLRGFGGAVTAGHYLATQAGFRVLADGGNAADAACAMGFALQVLEPHMNGPAGEAPILIYSAAEDRSFAISGQGTAPAAATLERMAELGLERIPGDGHLAATVPAALDAWCQLLERFGTLRLEDVMARARELALQGFPMYPFLRGVLARLEPRFREEWPTSAALYLPVREIGERQNNPAYASLLEELVHAERSAGGREAGIRAARDAFYRGRPADQIEKFLTTPVLDATGRWHAGLLRAEDLARYAGSVEEPVSVEYRQGRVWKCPPWTQGPVFLQQLRLLEGFDLAGMGRNSPEALHTWLECAKLAFADREACYGDPRFVDVPLDELLGAAYASQRRALVDPARASLELRPGLGTLPRGWPLIAQDDAESLEPQALATAQERASREAAGGRGDTTHLDAADRWGNLVSATPSGGWIPTSPVIPELGFPVGTRGQMFNLDPQHPNSLAPGKRPRSTLTPSLALLPDGRRLAFGTPGGDRQDQWALQFFLNTVDFGIADLQEAIDAPTLHSRHLIDSFYPHEFHPGLAVAEERIPRQVLSALERRGHRILRSGPWDHGRVQAVARHPDSGLCEAAASPRMGVAYAAVL